MSTTSKLIAPSETHSKSYVSIQHATAAAVTMVDRLIITDDGIQIPFIISVVEKNDEIRFSPIFILNERTRHLAIIFATAGFVVTNAQ